MLARLKTRPPLAKNRDEKPPGPGLRYVAEVRNERSTHEPAVEHRLKGTTGTATPTPARGPA